MSETEKRQRLKHPRVKSFVGRYLSIIKQVYAPEQVWLFGSFAHGRPNRWSDLDLMVVSRKFSRVERLRRRSHFLTETGIRGDRKFVVDPLCYTPAEFQRGRKMPTIIQEIVETGIRVV